MVIKVKQIDNIKREPESTEVIRLQNILFSEYGVCKDVDLYYRGRQDAYVHPLKCIVARRNEQFKFDTYFNGFSIYKWHKYTKVRNVGLTLDYSGSFKLILIRSTRNSNRIVEEILLNEYELNSINRVTQSFNFGEHDRGILSFAIICLKNDSHFYGGYYCTQIKQKEIKNVNLAISICTYKREQYINNTLNNINTQLLSDSFIKDKLHVYVSDNGNTLDTKKLSNDHVHVVWNKNAGGAGGFTRGIIEGMNSDKNHTHYLFMDDDIVFETDTIYRTIIVLSLLCEKYSDSFIGGSMLRMDKQSIIHESGGRWSNGRIESLKQGIDVSSIEGCLYNEVEESCQYNAWWYCVLPAKFVNKNNLPCPLFIKADDIEYSLRNMTNLILMNGISVWHEPFESKYSAHLHYYIIRNRLIVNSIRGLSDLKETIKLLKGEWRREMYLYRYDTADLILRGVEDFLKGVDYFKSINVTELHSEIMNSTYKMDYIENLNCTFSYHLYDRSMNEVIVDRPLLERCTFNGALLPVKKDDLKVVHAFFVNPSSCFRFKKILSYDYINNRGFVTEKNIKRMYQCISNYYRTIYNLKKNYARISSEFDNRSNEFTSENYWRSYLSLDKKS